jgi:hypothetical protein
MAQGNYIVSPANNNTDIKFNLVQNPANPLPSDQQDLIFDVGAVLESIRTIYAGDPGSFSDYFQQLLALAQLGLVGANAEPDLAKRALEHIKIEITNREAGKVKNKYLLSLGGKAAWFGGPALLLGTAIHFYYRHVNHIPMRQDYNDFADLLLLWSGTMLGVWLSFAITRTTIGFDDLTIIEKDRLEPSIRLFFTGALAVIFGLLFAKKAISIKLGDLSSDDLFKNPVTAFLIGVILGLNEKIIGSALTKKTAGLFDKL